jgi:hypothetical protein
MSRDRPPHCGVVGAAHGWMVEGGLSLVAHCGNGGKMRCGNRNQNKLMIVKSSDSRSLVWPPSQPASSPAACCAAVAQPARFTQLPTRTCSLLSSVRPVERESRTGAVSVRHVDQKFVFGKDHSRPAAQQCMITRELLPIATRASTNKLAAAFSTSTRCKAKGTHWTCGSVLCWQSENEVMADCTTAE